MVVTRGVTVGFAEVEVNPAGTEVQLYVFPATGAEPIWVLEFRQMALLAPALAVGEGLTITSTLLLFVQPVAVMVSVRV
jgi:hypothetical protein